MEARRDELDREIAQVRRRAREDAVHQVRALISEFDILAFEVYATRDERSDRKKLPDKYYDPDTGNSWSGRGKRPNWLKDKDPKDYLIPAEGILQALREAGADIDG